MRASSGRFAVALGSLGLLASCVAPGQIEDDLGARIQSYYDAHAAEEAGKCPTPEMASITRRKVLASNERETVLRVRYSYADPSVDETRSWPHVLIAERECAGFAERNFTLLRRKTGYVVTDMSGERRDDG